MGQMQNGEGTNGEDNFDDESGSRSRFRSGDHGGMTGDSGEDSCCGAYRLQFPSRITQQRLPEDPQLPLLHNVTSNRSSTFLNFTNDLDTINVLSWPSRASPPIPGPTPSGDHAQQY